MTRTVYSSAFIEYTAETPNNSFAVPEGFTAVVRQLSCYQEIGAYDFQVYIQNSAEAPALIIWAVTGVSAITSEATQGRWVVPGEGIITVIASAIGSSPSFYAGGYLLRNDD